MERIFNFHDIQPDDIPDEDDVVLLQIDPSFILEITGIPFCHQIDGVEFIDCVSGDGRFAAIRRQPRTSELPSSFIMNTETGCEVQNFGFSFITFSLSSHGSRVFVCEAGEYSVGLINKGTELITTSIAVPAEVRSSWSPIFSPDSCSAVHFAETANMFYLLLLPPLSAQRIRASDVVGHCVPLPNSDTLSVPSEAAHDAGLCVYCYTADSRALIVYIPGRGAVYRLALDTRQWSLLFHCDARVTQIDVLPQRADRIVVIADEQLLVLRLRDGACLARNASLPPWRLFTVSPCGGLIAAVGVTGLCAVLLADSLQPVHVAMPQHVSMAQFLTTGQLLVLREQPRAARHWEARFIHELLLFPLPSLPTPTYARFLFWVLCRAGAPAAAALPRTTESGGGGGVGGECSAARVTLPVELASAVLRLVFNAWFDLRLLGA